MTNAAMLYLPYIRRKAKRIIENICLFELIELFDFGIGFLNMFLFYYFQIFRFWPPLYVLHLSDTLGIKVVITDLQLCALRLGLLRLHYLHPR